MVLRWARCALFLGLLLLCWASPVHAQDPEPQPVTVEEIILMDGSKLIGTVTQEDDEVIQFTTVGGVSMTITKDQIRSRLVMQGSMKEGRFYRKDPNSTRLLFSPTARALRGGQGYFAAYEIFFPFVAYGVGNIATLAGGISLVPGLGQQLIYLAPKITVYERRTVAVGVGTFFATPTGESEYAGIAYAVGTFGSSELALTLGGGVTYGIENTDDGIANTPLILIGGEWQVSNSIKLISENYILTNEDTGILLSAGVRFFGERLSADLAFFTSPEIINDVDFPFFPWIGFFYNFGP